MARIDKEREEKIKEMIRKAGDAENYETTWDEKGLPKSKKKTEIKKGKQSKSRGNRFELKVRKDLERKRKVVDKWSNNVDLEKNELAPAKRKYNPFKKVMTIGTGFPDFIAIEKVHEHLYSVIGVEVKINGKLSKEEKQKCAWYLQKGVFSAIWVAKEVKNGRKSAIEYDDFKEKYGDKYNKA